MAVTFLFFFFLKIFFFYVFYEKNSESGFSFPLIILKHEISLDLAPDISSYP